jgi:Flp pilus assembly protein TadD
MAAAVIAGAVVLAGIRGFHQNNFPAVEGAKEEQQKSADRFRAELARDSTSVDAHIGLADVLYDTGNWSEAIVHYRAALARDSSRASTFVDLGVCYYNLGNSDEAEVLFTQALRRDPHQPVALFNLGIVSERRGDNRAALQYLHRALESAPPENMRPPLIEAMQRVQKALGVKAPAMPEGGH